MKRCVDEPNVVVDDAFCQNQPGQQNNNYYHSDGGGFCRADLLLARGDGAAHLAGGVGLRRVP